MLATLALLLTQPLPAQHSAGLPALEKQRALSELLASEIRRPAKPFDNPLVEAYVKQVGARLVSHLDDAPLPYNFELLQTPAATEPISLPGGHILIPASFLLTAQDEAEFAGMLAHAIAHIALQHGTRGSPPAYAAHTTPIPVIFMGGWAGLHADSRQGAVLPLGFLAAQRTRELDANRFGLNLAARAGYDPAGLRRYVERLQAPNPARSSPLPPRDTRLAAIDDLLRSLAIAPTAQAAAFSQAQAAVRQALDRPKPNRHPTLHR